MEQSQAWVCYLHSLYVILSTLMNESLLRSFLFTRIENVRENPVRHECFQEMNQKVQYQLSTGSVFWNKVYIWQLPISFFQVYVQWFNTWICKKESYIDLSILLDIIHIFTVYISLYQSLVSVGIQILKHSVVLIFLKSKETNWSWIRHYTYISMYIYAYIHKYVCI